MTNEDKRWKHHEIKLKYKRIATAKETKYDPTRARIRELQLLVDHRYPDTISDTEVGRAVILAMIAHKAQVRANIESWCARHAPWIEDELDDLDVPSLRLMKADKLGQEIQLTYAVRTRLRIKTIRAYDVTPAQCKELEREERRDRDRRRRRAKGAKPRQEYLANLGRRSTYRRRNAVQTTGATSDHPTWRSDLSASDDTLNGPMTASDSTFSGGISSSASFF
jgi:hypothetical protein